MYFLRFRRDEQGNVTDIFHGPDVYENVQFSTRLSNPNPPAWEAYPGHYVSHNPWYSGFRVFLRKGELVLSYPMEGEEPLTELESGNFRIGKDEWSPEWIRFEVNIDEKTTQAVFSGARYYRTFTPSPAVGFRIP
jgi:hypothetical protein